jgi:hypothetical protein
VVILLMAASILGFFSSMATFARDRMADAWDKVSVTVGMTAFLSAITLVVQRSGMLAGLLLLLLSWLLYDLAARLNGLQLISRFSPWVGIILLLTYIGTTSG